MGTPLTFFPVSGHWYAAADPAISGHSNQPEVEPMNGLVLFTPRLAIGQTMWVEDFLVTAAYDTLQTVTKINNPNSGLWKLNLLGTWTTDLAWDISNATLEAALIAAAGAAVGDITVVTGLNPQSYDCQFKNGLGSQDIPTMVADPNTLMNALGQTCAVSVSSVDHGTEEIVAPTAIAIPPLQARIWMGELSTIDYEDTPGFQLVSSMPEFELPDTLVYDVTFSKVTYNGKSRTLAPWAFEAPTDETPVCLTSKDLVRLPWERPIDETWTPEAEPSGLTLVGGHDWRARAAAEADARRPKRRTA